MLRIEKVQNGYLLYLDPQRAGLQAKSWVYTTAKELGKAVEQWADDNPAENEEIQ